MEGIDRGWLGIADGLLDFRPKPGRCSAGEREPEDLFGLGRPVTDKRGYELDESQGLAGSGSGKEPCVTAAMLGSFRLLGQRTAELPRLT
jgi:hypothetical protein